MKKFIFSAALIICFSGFAAAQSNSTKASTKKEEQKTIKKGADTKTTAKDVIKDSSMKTVKISIPVAAIDTVNGVPKIKNEQ